MNIQSVIDTVCNFRGIDPESLNLNTKKREICETRQIIHYLCIEFSLGSQRVIGEAVGEKDHATVLHSHKTVANLIETDARIRNEINQLRQAIELNKPITITVTINELDSIISRLTELKNQKTA